MPINYKEYHPDWKAISLHIRKERAGDRCDWCDRPNRSMWMRGPHRHHEWEPAFEGHEADALGEIGYRFTMVVLTVAHIDHDKTNNDETNLAALCQRCHLNHDRHQHANNRRYGRNWKRDQLALFDPLSSPLKDASEDGRETFAKGAKNPV